MMAPTLARDYDMIQSLAQRASDRIAAAASLEDRATALWDLDAPGPE